MIKRIACIVMSAGMFVPVLANADTPRPSADQGTTGINGNTSGSGAVRTSEPNPTNSRVKADADGAKAASDKAFVTEAASGGMLEVQLGQLVQQKGQSEQAKNFAKMMVDDHTKANTELMAVAQKNNIMLSKELNEKDQATLTKMQKMSGGDLDRAYLADMVEDHKKDIATYETEAQNGQNAEVKAFAASCLPTLRTHLTHAQQSLASVGTTDSAQPAGQRINPDKDRTPDVGKTTPTNQGNSGNNATLSPPTPNK